MIRIISRKTLKAFWQRYPDAEKPLRYWHDTTRRSAWADFSQVKQTFGSADQTHACHGNTVVIFDIGGNKYRLIASIHYNTQVVYAMLVLTHKEYDRGKWKVQLC